MRAASAASWLETRFAALGWWLSKVLGALVNLDPPVEDKFRFRSHSASPTAELSKTAAFAPRIASCGAAHKDRLSYTN